MRDEILPSRIICEGGLNTNESSLVLSQDLPGSAIRLVNYESSISGGYRRISGFQPFDRENEIVAPDEAEGRILGTYVFYNSETRSSEVYAARKLIGEDEYGIFKLGGTGWERVTLPNPRAIFGPNSSVSRIRFEVYNAGSGNHLFLVDGVNSLLWFNGTVWEEIVIDHQDQQIINSPMVISVFKNHLFIACDASDETVIAHSAPNDPSDWSSAGGAGQIFPGFEVVNIRPFRDELYIFGTNRIRKIVVEGTDFVLKDVTNDLGCIARDSVLEIAGNLIFLSQDGIRPVAGTEKISDVDLGLLSLDIQPDMNLLIAQGDLQTLHGVVIRTKTQFRYFYSNEVVPTKEASGLIGCLRKSKRTGREWEFSDMLGIRASCSWSGFIDGREQVIHGDYGGGIYLHDSGSSFNGDPIYSIYQTPFLDFGNTELRKTMRTVNLFMKNEGISEISLGFVFDWNSNEVVNPSNQIIDQDVKTFFYDNEGAKFDTAGVVYGNSNQSKIKINVSGSGESISLIFFSEGIYDPYIIQGFVIELTERGRQ